jgi:hypothetical protein
MVKPAKKLEPTEHHETTVSVNGANKLSKLIGRFDRLLILVIIVIIASVGLIVFRSSAPKPKHCDTEACFNSEFKNCTPASFDYSVQSLGSINYQIMSGNITSGGCYVTLTYLKDPNPSWENKPMTCIFNNKVPVRQSASDVFNDLLAGHNTYSCTGPLVSVIQGPSSNE